MNRLARLSLSLQKRLVAARQIPLDNLWVPDSSINRRYPDRIQFYSTQSNFKNPTGVAETEYYNADYFRGWVKLTDSPPQQKSPNVFITDGVHRILALEKRGENSVMVTLTDRV